MPTQRTDHPYSTWHGSRGNRLPAVLYPSGTPAHVTICTAEEQDVFLRDRWARPVFDLCARHPETLACCLMPDHLHWLVRDSGTMSQVVGGFKSFTTHRLRALGFQGRLWQRSFWDHVVREAESLEETARYIVNNPVRRGLVEEPKEYPYWVVRLQDPLPGGVGE